MKLIFIIQIVFLILVLNVSAEKPPLKWGELTDTEINMKNYPSKMESDAAILCDYGKITILNRTVYERHVRIKIFTEEGKKYSVVKIPYNPENKHDDIVWLKGQTINATGEKIILSDVKNKHIETIEESENRAYKILHFQDVKPGSIIEYKYEIGSMDIISLDSWYFQSDIPTLWSELRFEVPEPFTFLMTFEEGHSLTINESNMFAKELQWMLSTREKQWEKKLKHQNSVLFSTFDSRYKVHVVSHKLKKIILKNVPGWDVDSSYYSHITKAPKLKFHLFNWNGNMPQYYKPLIMAAYNDKTPSRSEVHSQTMPPGFVHYSLETWNEFTTRYLTDRDYGAHLRRPFDYVEILDKLGSAEASEKEKIEAVYIHVRDHFKWDGSYSLQIDDNLQKVYDRGSGSGSEINLVMIYLMRRAGLDVSPVLTKSLQSGSLEMVYPFHNQFDHTIAMVRLNGERYLLDATIDDRPHDVIMNNYLHPYGWILDKDRADWISINLQ